MDDDVARRQSAPRRTLLAGMGLGSVIVDLRSPSVGRGQTGIIIDYATARRQEEPISTAIT
jgi:hypothetical protein